MIAVSNATTDEACAASVSEQPETTLPSPFVLRQFDRVTSTNDVAREAANAGAAHGTVVLADRQSAGRGRQGRAWVSGEGNLLCSIVLRPRVGIRHAAQLSLVAGIAVAESLVTVTSLALAPTLKWPNDVMISGQKISGILLESRLGTDGMLDFAILGLGINLASHPEITNRPATSLAGEGFPGVRPFQMLREVCFSLGKALDHWERDGFAGTRSTWLSRAFGLGETISVTHSDTPLIGRFEGLDDTGSLLLRTSDGALVTVTAGDVSLVRTLE